MVTLDQRWHGRGIQSEEFSLHDCADDVAALIDVLGLEDVIVAGYSMGSIIAQRVWRQHPDKIGGLVLCATTDRFRSSIAERGFHQGMEVGDARHPRAVPVADRGPRRTNRGRGAGPEPDDIHEWAFARVPQHQPLGGRPGRRRPRPASLAAVALAHRRADRRRW